MIFSVDQYNLNLGIVVFHCLNGISTIFASGKSKGWVGAGRRFPLGIAQAGHKVAFPSSVDPEIIFFLPVYLESQTFQDPGAPVVAGNVAGFDTMKIQLLEDEMNRCFQGFDHHPFAFVILIDFVSQAARLESATLKISEIDHPNHFF